MTYEECQALEEEARRLTWHAWIDRDVGRLFPLPEIVAVRQRHVKPRWWGERNARVWRALDDEFRGRAVGVVPPMDNLIEAYSEHTCVVGVWAGIATSFLGGSGLSLTRFSGPGCTQHRSLFNVGFVYLLPEHPFQHLADHLWDDEGTVRCGGCDYLFVGEESPCNCHWLCASCCVGERSRAAVRDGIPPLQPVA